MKYKCSSRLIIITILSETAPQMPETTDTKNGSSSSSARMLWQLKRYKSIHRRKGKTLIKIIARKFKVWRLGLWPAGARKECFISHHTPPPPGSASALPGPGASCRSRHKAREFPWLGLLFLAPTQNCIGQVHHPGPA